MRESETNVSDFFGLINKKIKFSTTRLFTSSELEIAIFLRTT